MLRCFWEGLGKSSAARRMGLLGTPFLDSQHLIRLMRCTEPPDLRGYHNHEVNYGCRVTAATDGKRIKR